MSENLTYKKLAKIAKEFPPIQRGSPFGFHNYSGTKFVEIPETIEEKYETRVKRSWKERLFSIPWRPLQREKIIVKTRIIKNPLADSSKLLYYNDMIYGTKSQWNKIVNICSS